MATCDVTRVTATAMLITLCAARPSAQDQSPILEAAFEVASFKRNPSGGNPVWRPQATGEFTLINVPFETRLLGAYQLQPYQLIGVPSWIRDERYDILARLDPQVAGRLQPDGHPPTWALALRSLLTERARLAFHRETRELPIYALVMARADRRPGPHLGPAKADCDALRLESASAARAGLPSPYPAGMRTWIPCGLFNGPGRIVSGGYGFAEFLSALSNQVGRPVVDRTGLSGKWDFFLTYSPDTALTTGGPVDANAPQLFTACRSSWASSWNQPRGRSTSS